MEQEMDNVLNNEPMGASQAPEQMVAEQVTVAEVGPVPAMPEAPKKKSSGMLIGLILCLLIAAGGVGFGVWEMIDGNAQKESLNKQISELKKTNNELMDKLNNATVVDDDTIIDVDTDGDVNTEDYIYVGEWGVKIKIPEDLVYLEYKLTRSSDVSTLCLNGGRAEDKDYTTPDGMIANINMTSMGCINRAPKGSYSSKDASISFDYDNYSFWYDGFRGGFTENEEGLASAFLTDVDIIEKMLTNEDNYSAI